MNPRPFDVNAIKKQVPLPVILAHYGIKTDGVLINCLWHPDRVPSLRVWDDHAYCYGCHKTADIFSFVCKLEKIPYSRAVDWVLEHQKILPKDVLLERPAQAEYRGPVPLAWAQNWHSQLTPERREYLHARLLTDETIDFNLIGYRPDENGYSIPFWRGLPRRSEIDIIQLRADPKASRAWKYKGIREKEYYRPSIINYHLINPKLVIVVFGTLDALLGAQDGLPMISTNGAGMFANPKRAESAWLKRVLEKTEQVIIVPDNQPIEFESAHRLADMLGAKVAYFPKSCGIKDYNDWRLAGHTPEEFYTEVLQMTPIKMVRGPEGALWPIHKNHIILVGKMLSRVSEGDWFSAAQLIDKMREDDPASYERPHLILWSLQRMTELRLEPVQEVFASDEWKAMASAFYGCSTYKELGQVLVEWSNLATERLGGF